MTSSSYYSNGLYKLVLENLTDLAHDPDCANCGARVRDFALSPLLVSHVFVHLLSEAEPFSP